MLFWKGHSLRLSKEDLNIKFDVVLFFTDKAREMWGDLHSKWVNAFPQGEIVITNKSYHYPQKDEPEMVVAQVVKLLERTK